MDEPRTLERKPDCLAIVTLLPTSEGGRQGPAASGYRPHHVVREDLWTSGAHTYLDTEWLQPGETSRAHIVFLAPEHYPGCLWVGRVLPFHEGNRLVGHAEITEIFNPRLDRDGGSATPASTVPE